MTVDYDYCVVGGGIIGVATAHSLLKRHPGAGVVLVEKESALGCHQTGHNSGVIHSGIYYAPGSLKARLCSEGERLTKQFCREHGIPFEERGKLIVATSPIEEVRLEALAERAQRNGIAIERLSQSEIVERESHISGTKGLFVPAAAIVDYGAVLKTMADNFVAQGGTVLLQNPVLSIQEETDWVEVGLQDRNIRARRLIACAGLQSDRLAKIAGLYPTHQIIPFRGEYYRVRSERGALCNSMIYPVPDPALPFLGIHLTPLIDGRLTVGPNAVLGFAREGYGKGAASVRDILSYASFPGFWRALANNWKSGVKEMLDSAFKQRYLRACQKYCPSLTLEDLQPMEAGIRAQAVAADGTLLHDFLFLDTPRMLHVCNAPSPAATSAMPIADMIVDRLEEMP